MNLHQPTAYESERASLRRMARRRRFPFATSPSAYIPAAEQHGGLGMADVGSDSIAPVVAVLDPYKPYKSGDLVLLLWDGEQIASRSMSPADDDLPISLPIERADLRRFGDGEHRLVARFVPVLGDPQDSPPYPCFVKTTRPGGIDTDPATETINENLAPPTLRPMPVTDDLDNVRIVLRRYDNIAVGDLIYGSWHGRVLPVPPATPTPLTAADLGKTEFEIAVPRAVVEDVGGGDILVRYRILDRVANSSLWSPGLDYTVPIDDPGAPREPWVEDTRGDEGKVLVLNDLADKNVKVIVESHTGLKDERIRVSWAGIANGQAVPVYQTDWQNVSRDGQTLTFVVPNAKVVILGEGSVTVTYELERLDRSTITSRRRVLAIEGKASTLLPPLVLDTPGDILDAAAHKGGATLVAPHQPERIPAGSFVRFQWRGLAEGSTEETADGVNATFGVMTYPQILALVGSTVTLNYRAETFGAASRLRPRPIAHPLAFDESRNLVLNVIDSEGAQPGLLPPPSIREAMGNVLDPDIALAHMDIPALTRGDRVTAHIDAKAPFLQTIPMGDPSRPPSFQLTQDNFIRANANTEASAWYLVTGDDGYIASSGPYVFTIGHAQAELPPPTVDHAAGGTLDPIDAIDGAIVRVPAVLTTNDTVVVHFGTYDSAPVKWSANLAVTVPPADVARHLGRTIDVTYTVNGTDTSPALRLTVQNFQEGDTRLPTPAITEAKNGVLDLASFSGDAHTTIAKWPLIAVGQKVWIQIDGTGLDGRPETYEVVTATGVTAAEVSNGLSKITARARLENFKDGTPITVNAWVTFDQSSDKARAIHFPLATYTIRGTAQETGIETFDGYECSFPRTYQIDGRVGTYSAEIGIRAEVVEARGIEGISGNAARFTKPANNRYNHVYIDTRGPDMTEPKRIRKVTFIATGFDGVIAISTGHGYLLPSTYRVTAEPPRYTIELLDESALLGAAQLWLPREGESVGYVDNIEFTRF